MKKYFTVLIILIISSSYNGIANLYDWAFLGNVNTGVQPSEIITDEQHDVSYIFCLGKDSLYDGIWQEGDVSPSMWKVPANGISEYNFDAGCGVKVIDFGMGAFAWDKSLRPTPDFQNDIIYLTRFGRVSSYKLSSGELIEDTVALIEAAAISLKDDELFFSVRVDDNQDWVIDTNLVIVYNRSTKQFTDTIAAFGYVQQSIPLSNGSIAVLCEGTFGSNDSKLMFIEKVDGKYVITSSFDIGDCGNHIYYDKLGEFLALTMNGSHQVHIFSIQDMEIKKTYDIPGGAWEGPRESVIFYPPYVNKGYKTLSEYYATILTTTYSGVTYWLHDEMEESITDTLQPTGKTEGIAVFYNLYSLFSNQFFDGTYQPDSTVAVFFMPIGSVEDSEPEYNPCEVFPNPCDRNSELRINTHYEYSGIAEIKLYGSDASLINDFEAFISGSEIKLNLGGLYMPPGVYFLKIKINDRVFISKVSII